MRRIAIAGLLALLVAGCGEQERSVSAQAPEPRALETAAAALRSELEAAAAALGRRGLEYERVAPAPCEGAGGRVTSGLVARFDREPGEDPKALVRTAARHWRATGWTGRRTPLPAAFATRPDGTTLALKALPDRSFELSGGTPCVTP